MVEFRLPLVNGQGVLEPMNAPKVQMPRGNFRQFNYT